ncbi:MAG TPA: hypothetical protein VGJ92_04880 [Methanocella sp.]|jgi:hypothetical protein
MIKELPHSYPYMGTSVPFERTLMQIESLLKKFGCSKTAKQDDSQDPTLPMITLLFQHGQRSYIIEFPIVYEVMRKGPKRLRMDVSARIMHDYVKSLLIIAEVMGFDVALSPLLLLRDKAGNSKPMYEAVVEHADQLASGGFDLLALPEARR